MPPRDKVALAAYNKQYREDNHDKIKALKAAWSKKRRAVKKEYVIISGKQKRVKYPNNIVDILDTRFKVSRCSKTGLRWSDSDANKYWLRGQEAGYFMGAGYLFVSITIDSVSYTIQVANIVWMLTHKKTIEEGKIIDHINHNRSDNRIENLRSDDCTHNAINCSHKKAYGYPNVRVKKFYGSTKVEYFVASFTCLGTTWCSKYVRSQDYAFVLGWELLISGQIPLRYIKSKTLEYLDGTYLQRALAECAKQGTAVTPPKFKTLYEYIASVEGSC
jgi:hypothetical protein